MTRYAIVWTGEIIKSVVAETPADGAYWLWSHYRQELLPGATAFFVEEHEGVRMVVVHFRARIAREIEAETASEAVRTMTFDTRLPSSFRVVELTVEEIVSPASPSLAAAAE